MKQYRGIAMTDGVNRLNHMIPASTILQSYEKTWNQELPCSINHDHTKFVGWNRLKGLYFEPGKMYQTIELDRAETKEEKEDITKRCNEYLMKYKYEERQGEYINLVEKLGSYVVGEYEPGLVNAVAIINEGIVLRVFPELENEVKKKGLLDLKLFEPILPGVYKRGNYLLFAHPYLRRSLSRLNTFAESLLEKLENLRNTDINVEIALDMDMIGLVGTQDKEVEYQYWWGPHFSENLDQIDCGITRHNNQQEQVEYSNVSFTEFGWHIQDDKKTFEVEEIVGNPNIHVGEDNEKYGCRYVHSILNSETKLPCHLDGAIRAYDLEKYVDRINVPLDKAGRDTEYTKLWRIDNDIPVGLWKELISDYYRDNMLIGEYFGGIDTTMNEIVSENECKEEKQYIEEFIPTRMEAGMGVRVYFQYFQLPAMDVVDDAVIYSPYTINLNEGYFYEIEADMVTLAKEIKRRGVKISLDGYIEVAREDMIHNFPIIICRDIKIAEVVQEAINQLVSIWIDKDDDRLISYSLEYPLDDRWVRICFAGHIKDVLSVLTESACKLPSQEEMNTWMCNLYEYITKMYPHTFSPRAMDLISLFDDLRFKRTIISNNQARRVDGKAVINIPCSLKEFKKLLEDRLVVGEYRAILQ